MAENKATASSNVTFSFSGLLLVILIVLKLNPGGHLDSPVQDWSWWLVIFAPLLISLAILGVILGVFAIGAGIVFAIAGILDWNDKRKREKARQERINKRVGPDRFSK